VSLSFIDVWLTDQQRALPKPAVPLRERHKQPAHSFGACPAAAWAKDSPATRVVSDLPVPGGPVTEDISELRQLFRTRRPLFSAGGRRAHARGQPATSGYLVRPSQSIRPCGRAAVCHCRPPPPPYCRPPRRRRRNGVSAWFAARGAPPGSDQGLPRCQFTQSHCTSAGTSLACCTSMVVRSRQHRVGFGQRRRRNDTSHR
jgi:hypothetical protein